MNTPIQTIDDLNIILSLLNKTKERYSFSAEITRSKKLQNLFTTYAIRRMLYTAELKTLIDSCGGKPNMPVRTTDALYRTWVNFKQVLIGKHDEELIDSLVAEDISLINKYNQCVQQYQHQSGNMRLLIKHRDGIQEALNEISATSLLVY